MSGKGVVVWRERKRGTKRGRLDLGDKRSSNSGKFVLSMPDMIMSGCNPPVALPATPPGGCEI